MADLQTILQLAQLLALITMAAGVFVRLGRIYSQMERTVEDVGELRRDVRSLGDQWSDLRNATDRTAVRLDGLERRVDRIETSGHSGHGLKGALT